MGEEKKEEEARKQEVEEKDGKPSQREEDKTKSEVEKKEKEEIIKEIDEEVKEIVMNVYMHCEGCARKVRKCLKNFEGVQEVITECKWQKVVVKGEKLDPVKVVERVQKKSHRQVELVSPIPKHDDNNTPPQENNVEVNAAPQTNETKQEPKVMTVTLKVHMHCEACSLEIKKRIERMKEVEEAIPDLKNSQVSVKGTFDPTKLVNYVYKRTGKHATILKQDPLQETKDDDKGKDGNKLDEKMGEDEENKGEEKVEEGGGDGGGTTSNGGGATTEETLVGSRRNVYSYNNYYPTTTYAMEMNTYPPQMFSDENPNACFIM